MSSVADELIIKIASLQSRGDVYFPEGVFPSYRQNKYFFYQRPDTNIFFTSTIVFILNQVKPLCSAASQQLIEEITSKAIRNYGDFQNMDGLMTYNFWQTPKGGRVSNHFPNGYVFRRYRHFKIPDDIDDTALAYLTLPHAKEDVLWLKEKLKEHANLATRQVSNTFVHYKSLKIYSTWFGKNMPIEFDVCALCNLMYLFERHKISQNEYDVDSYTFMREVVLREEYISRPFGVAHNYATTPLIIYHYARLMGDFVIEALEDCREKLVGQAIVLLDKGAVGLNKVILETALMKLSKGDKRVLALSDMVVQPVDSDFRYFIAGLLSSYEQPVLQVLAPLKISQMEWRCEAHNYALVLESMFWKGRREL